MLLLEAIAALVILIGMVVLGTIVHELTHAFVLQCTGIPFEITWLPDRGATRPSYSGAIAIVTPSSIPDGTSPLGLRLSGLAPLVMVVPVLLLGATGAVPATSITMAAVIGWLACAIPSPQDFSLFWNAEEIVQNPDNVHG